jgi:kinesin family protein 3/17
MQKGALSRATATTKMNDLSSRSHAVFIIIVEQMTNLEDQYDDGSSDDAPKQIKVGKLNLVDLAGSERVRVTGATGKRLEESKKINQSLSCLGNVIAALTD